MARSVNEVNFACVSSMAKMSSEMTTHAAVSSQKCSLNVKPSAA
jgi:hypothetical protein